MRSILFVMAVLVLLAGCRESVQDPEEVLRVQSAGNDGGTLHFSYPMDGQAAVPVSAPLLLRFSDDIETPISSLNESVVLRNAQEETVPLASFRFVGDGRGLRAKPEQPLLPGSTYELAISGLKVGGSIVNAEGIMFTTERASAGVVSSQAGNGEPFRVRRFVPYGDAGQSSLGDGTRTFPVSDMASLRLVLTHPVATPSLEYGETVRLTHSSGELVPARLWATGRRLTVDPREDLEAGASYTLHLSDAIRSRGSDATLQTPDAPWRFTPVASESPTGARARMPQRAVIIGGDSALSGSPVNSVELSSTLLGQNNRSAQEGILFADLGYIPRFDQADRGIPLRVEQGTLIKGSNVDVRIGGKVPAGFSSGQIDVRFLSDANGYLLSNPYSSEPDAPRVVRLFMDMALNTEGERANGALAQSLMHVELVGTARVEDGTLTLKAVSVIEPEVMGVESASGLISFRLEKVADASQLPPESALADRVGPALKGWHPGNDGQAGVMPDERFELVFDEPLDTATINRDTVQLVRRGTQSVIPLALTVDGSRLKVRPEERLSYGAGYQLELASNRITDLAGNPLQRQKPLKIDVPPSRQGIPDDRGPMVLTTLPGYPCAKTGSLDAGEDTQGRCLGGITLDPDVRDAKDPAFGPRTADDALPIEAHPANQPVRVRFSQPMDATTLTAGETVILEEREDGEWHESTGYQLKTSSRSLTIIPETPWEKGRLYRYRLIANEIRSASVGLPLQTQLLAQNLGDIDWTTSDPPLVNHFRGAAVNQRVPLPLTNSPTLDANSDLRTNAPEALPEEGEIPPNSAQNRVDQLPPESHFAGSHYARERDSINELVKAANIGCKARQKGSDEFNCAPAEAMKDFEFEQCPRQKFIKMTGRLDATVLPASESPPGEVAVNLEPTVLLTTGLDVNVYVPAFCLLAGPALHQVIPTGPMVMRLRYDGQDRDQPIPGTITRDSNNQLVFRTEPDVYLDAPFMDPNLPTTNEMEHNMLSFRIDDLALEGPIRFHADGGMSIEQRNVEPVELDDVAVVGSALGDGLLDATTIMDLEIPAGALRLRYESDRKY